MFQWCTATDYSPIHSLVVRIFLRFISKAGVFVGFAVFCFFFQAWAVGKRVSDWTIICQSWDQKVTQAGGSILALFTKQKTPRLLRKMSRKLPQKGSLIQHRLYLPFDKRLRILVESEGARRVMSRLNLIHHPASTFYRSRAKRSGSHNGSEWNKCPSPPNGSVSDTMCLSWTDLELVPLGWGLQGSSSSMDRTHSHFRVQSRIIGEKFHFFDLSFAYYPLFSPLFQQSSRQSLHNNRQAVSSVCSLEHSKNSPVSLQAVFFSSLI